jgi:hypothetical protein
MGSKTEMTRKEFLVLTFTLVGAAATTGAACDDDDNNATGSGGTTGGGRGGTTGSGGSGGSGGGTAGNGNGGNGTAAGCSDPLPEVQAPSDHTHTLTIPASTLDATTAQTFNTGVTDAHMHMVTLAAADLATIKGGGSVTVTSTVAIGHSHMFTVSCT